MADRGSERGGDPVKTTSSGSGQSDLFQRNPRAAFEIKRACIGYGYQIESNLVSSSAFYESWKQRESRSISARDENVER